MSNVISMARGSAGQPITALRLEEMGRLAQLRHGHGPIPVHCPDGYALMVAVLDHYQFLGADAHRASFIWLMSRVKGYDHWSARDEIAEAVNRAPVYWKAQDLGDHLQLGLGERVLLGIKTIRATTWGRARPVSAFHTRMLA